MKKEIFALALGLATMSVRAGTTVDFDHIVHWAGEGEKRAALIIQFNDDKANGEAYVWGYRWNGSASGEDMLRAIARASRCLTPLIQYTGNMGSTLNGIGLTDGRDALCDYLVYDFEGAKDGSAFDFYNPNTSLGQTDVPGDAGGQMCVDAIERARTVGYIEHPINAFRYGYPSYDYDYWKLSEDVAYDSGYRWQAGWYEGYWSYWCGGEGDTTDDLSYSGLGMSSRQLEDGSIDLWNFCPNMTPCEPSATLDYDIAYYNEKMTEPEPIVRPIDHADVKFWVGSGEKSATVVFQFNDGRGPENLIYGYRWTGGWDDNFENVVKNIAKADPRMNAVFEGNTVKITYDSDCDGAISGTKDHTDIADTWNFYANRVADNEYIKVPKSRWLNPAAVLIVSHQPADVSEVSLPYQLFRPAPDSEELFTIPAHVDYALADKELTIPVFMQLPEGAKLISTSGKKDDNLTSIINSIGSANSTFMSTVKFKNFTPMSGEVWLECSYRKNGETKNNKYTTNRMTLNAMAPVRPVTAIHYEQASVDARLSHPVENTLVFEPADATYTKMAYATSNRNAATVNSTTGVVTTTTTAGSADITATYDYDKSLTATYSIASSLVNPVEDVTFEGADADGVITLTPKEMTGLMPIFTPEDPDIHTLNIELADNGTSKDNYIATMYTVNIWDENNSRSQFNELSGHRAGQCKLTVKSNDGSGFEKEFTINVVEPERETPIDYTTGTIMLNEEWFGHTNGGLNWYSPDYEVVYQAYERENPGESFGCTSQYGIIYNDMLFVSSKQAKDNGDPLPGGGRLVIADATTLKRLGSIDDIMWGTETKSSDGRALCGINPSKIYMSTNAGIYVIDIADPTAPAVVGKVQGVSEGDNPADLYNGQVGDMVHAGEYVFAVCQNTGIYVIDVLTDAVVKAIEDPNVQGVTQSADGKVWYATIDSNKLGNFVALDIETLEEAERVVVPAEIGTVTCGWGAWRTTQFTSSHTVNSLFFAPGSSVSNGGGGVYYSYDIDNATFKKIFDINGMAAHTPGMKQGAYGTIRYDARTNEIIVGTTEFKASGHYRYNWTHFVDATTGKINRTVELRPYYWFQSHAIFPDLHEPEFNLDEMRVCVNDTECRVNLHDFANDNDNINANIKFALDQAETVAEEGAANDVADVTLEGKHLVIKPRALGSKYFNLNVESNGKTITKPVKLNITVAAGIDDVNDASSIFCDGRILSIDGYNGETFAIYDVTGRKMVEFIADSDNYRAGFSFGNGVYVLRGANNVIYKFILK